MTLKLGGLWLEMAQDLPTQEICGVAFRNFTSPSIILPNFNEPTSSHYQHNSKCSLIQPDVYLRLVAQWLVRIPSHGQSVVFRACISSQPVGNPIDRQHLSLRNLGVEQSSMNDS
jgi:hypothetical protein